MSGAVKTVLIIGGVAAAGFAVASLLSSRRTPYYQTAGQAPSSNPIALLAGIVSPLASWLASDSPSPTPSPGPVAQYEAGESFDDWATKMFGAGYIGDDA